MKSGYLLHQNFLNPFNAGTVIRFEIPPSLANTSTRLAIYNVRGKLVRELINRRLPREITSHAGWEK